MCILVYYLLSVKQNSHETKEAAQGSEILQLSASTPDLVVVEL